MWRDLFKKIRDTKGTFQAKMGSINDRNGMDLTEAEDIKKRWQEYTEPYKKDLHDPDNHDGVITDLEPDILECEVKWALESIIWTKLVEVMEFQLSYLKSWKMMLWKCCTQNANKYGKLSSGHRTGKGQFSFQSQRKAMPKNAQTTAQLHSSHMLVKKCQHVTLKPLLCYFFFLCFSEGCERTEYIFSAPYPSCSLLQWKQLPWDCYLQQWFVGSG